MNQELLDLPPLRVRAYAAKAHENINGLMGHLASGENARDRLLDLVSNADPAAAAARNQWVDLVRAYAQDHYADAGFQALGWTQAMLDASQLLKMLAQDLARDTAREVWQIHSPWAIIDHGPASGAIPASSQIAPGVVVRVLEMDDVIRETRALSRKSWCQLTRVVAKWLVDADAPSLALATGAVGAMALGGRMTRCEHLHLGGEPLDWHLHIHWLDPEAGAGPTGEDLTDEVDDLFA